MAYNSVFTHYSSNPLLVTDRESQTQLTNERNLTKLVRTVLEKINPEHSDRSQKIIFEAVTINRDELVAELEQHYSVPVTVGMILNGETSTYVIRVGSKSANSTPNSLSSESSEI